MAATDPVITLAAFLKLEAPDGDVRLSDGGVLDFDAERYQAQDAVFGTIWQPEAIDTGFGDSAEDGRLTLAPHPEADVADWWRTDLHDCRLRWWLGELDADGVTVSSAEQQADLLVDTCERVQDLGEDLLSIELIGRGDKLFLRNEGNICSDTFHQSVWSGELGFENCTDLVGYVAWGAAAPPRAAGGTGGFVPGSNRGTPGLVQPARL